MATKTTTTNAKLFSNFILRRELPNISESGSEDYKFGFRTVFYTSPYSYRCCGCAFQHEYFTYLADEPAENQNITNNNDEDQAVEESTTIERDMLKNETSECRESIKEKPDTVKEASHHILNEAIDDRCTSENRSEKGNIIVAMSDESTSIQDTDVDLTDQDDHDTTIEDKRTSSVTSCGAKVVHIDKSVSDDRNCVDKGTFSDTKGLDKDTNIAETETFAKILQNIRNGQCEHVEKILEENWEYITDTAVHGIHIVAALLPRQIILNYARDIKIKHGLSSVFSVHPYTTFLMKNKRAVQSHEVDVFQCLMNISTNHINSDAVVWLGTKLDAMDKSFSLEPHSILEYFAKLNDKLVFQSFVEAHLKLFNFNDIAHIMETVINHGFVAIEKMLTEKLLAANVSNNDDGVPICELK